MAKSLNDFKQLCLLGEGAYSAVYKVLRLADREIYALKKVKLPSLSEKEKQNALNEVRLLASIKDDNIIAYKEAFFDDKTRCLCIVMEFSDSGDLFQQIVKCQKERTHLREADIWRYMIGMSKGLKALHDLRILHRDLKCANVFLSQGPDGEIIAKLGDLNVSKVAKRGLCMTQTGTPYYASPEVWRDMPYDAKSDMWSLGCVCYEMVALHPPFRAEDMEGLYRKVLRGQYPRIPPHFSHDLSELIGVLLQVNPRHRPSVDQLLQLPVMRRHDTSGLGDCSPSSDLLSTIKLPKNIIDFSAYLPKPQYHLKTSITLDEPTSNNVNLQDAFGDDVYAAHHSRYNLGGAATTNIQRGGAQQTQVAHEEILPSRGGRDILDSYKDSLDAQLQQLQAPPPDSYNSESVAPDYGRPQPHALVQDSLDAYLQQNNRVPPARQARGIDGHPSSLESNVALEDNQDTHMLPSAYGRDGGRAGGGRQELQAAHYGGGGAAGPSGGEVDRPQPPTYNGSQHRRGNERKPMASYARRGYSLSNGGAAVSQTPAAKPPTGVLHLPRILSKAG